MSPHLGNYAWKTTPSAAAIVTRPAARLLDVVLLAYGPPDPNSSHKQAEFKADIYEPSNPFKGGVPFRVSDSDENEAN